MQINSEAYVVNLNPSQTKIKLVNANTTFAVLPRGSGKTFLIGDRIEHLSEVMPRCQILLVGDTYGRINERIFANIESYFKNEVGMIEGEDYVKFRKPPVHWPSPFIPLNDFEHVVSFSSGLALCFVSLNIPGSGNAFNAQAMICDEAKYCDEKKITSEVLPAIRGASKIYGHLPEYGSKWYFTDKLGANIHWVLEKRKYKNDELINAIIKKQNEIFNLQQQMELHSPKSSARYEYVAKINEIEQKLNKIRRNLVYYCEGAAYENADNLPKNFFRNLRRELTKYQYEVSVENKDPDKVEHSFYPALSSQKHYHEIINDTSEDQPLCVAMDYQWRITPMTIGQFGKLPDREEATFNIVNAIHSLHPAYQSGNDVETDGGGIRQTVKLFCEYYSNRIDKIVYYLFDHTAIGKRPDGSTFKDIAVRAFKENGWIVIEKYMGAAPDQDVKFEDIKGLMNDCTITLNKIRCAPLIRSLSNAGAYTSGAVTKKDKSKEKRDNIDPIEQTDYSDSFDTLVYGVCIMKLVTPYVNSFVSDISIR